MLLIRWPTAVNAPIHADLKATCGYYPTPKQRKARFLSETVLGSLKHTHEWVLEILETWGLVTILGDIIFKVSIPKHQTLKEKTC